MNKFLFLLALVTSSLHASDAHLTEFNQVESTHLAEPVQLAMGDIGSLKSSLNDGAANDASALHWNQLSDDERKVLAPLGAEWDTLRPWQREKMLDIAKDYPKMDAQKKQRVQKRLISWSRMTPYERENARTRFQQFHSLSAEKKDEVRKKWAEHQKLPENEREKLRKDSTSWDYAPDLE